MATPNSLMSPQIALMDKIKATHLPDVSRDVDVAPLLLIVENIFDPTVHLDITHTAIHSELSFIIERISCEISNKALSKADAETTALAIFNMIGTYDWDVKLVLSLAAFSSNIANFLLINRTHSTDQLAESISKLRGLPNLSRNETLSKLVRALVKLARCVLEFKRLPSVYISAEFQAFANALEQIRFAAYWTVESILTCSIYISSITSIIATQTTNPDHGFQFTEADLSGCAQQLITTYGTLKQYLDDCNSHIVTKKNDEFYQKLVMYFETTTQFYSTTILLTNLVCANDNDRRPLDLIHCSSVSTSTTIAIDELNLVRKNVIVFFSSVEISKVEITNIIDVYEKHKAACEIVWIPIVEQWTDVAVTKFDSLRALMPWYTVCKPELWHPMVVKFVKEKWRFGSKPMLVVLDHKGKLTCSDAFHMVQIWGADAFPFTISRQKELWIQQTWKLDILIQSVQTKQSVIWNWIENKKLIFLCGGNNMDEVKGVIKSAVSTKHEFRIVCVSNSFTQQQFSSTMYEITQKQDGYCLIGEELFKLGLESMLSSRIQVGLTAKTEVLLGIQKILSYTKTTEWAMLCQGSEIKAYGLGSVVKNTFLQFSRWQEQATRDFAAAFVAHYQEISKLQLPPCDIPSQLKCPECNAIIPVQTLTATGAGVVEGANIASATSSSATATNIGAIGIGAAGFLDTYGVSASNIAMKGSIVESTSTEKSITTIQASNAAVAVESATIETSTATATNTGAGVVAGANIGAMGIASATGTNIGAFGIGSAGFLDTFGDIASNIAMTGSYTASIVESTSTEESITTIEASNAAAAVDP